MATVQQFDFLIRASTDLAIQKLNQLGAAAVTAATEIEGVENVDLNAWGHTALNAAMRAAGGMLSLATAASNVVEQANFVDQIFKDAAPGIKKWSETADRSALLSQQAALHAAAYLGVFGQTIGLTGDQLAGFSTNLVDLAADLASVANTPVDTAVTAIGAAMRNEYEPMRKYGVVLNEGMLKEALFAATGEQISGTMTQQQKIIAVNQALFQQLGFAIGDVDRTFGGMANQSRYLDAQMENLKAQIGEGIRPTFIALFSAANSAVGVLRDMPPVVAEVGGKVALAATAITGLTGVAAILYSTLPKVTTALSNMRQGFDSSGNAATRGQKAIAGFAKVAGFIGAVAVASDLAFSAINKATGSAEKFTDALQEISTANQAGKIKESYEAFLDLAKAQDKNLSMSHLWEDFGQRITLVGDDAKRSIEDVDAAFAKMLQQDPAAAANVLDYMKEQNAELDHSSKQYQLNEERIKAWTDQVKSTTTAAQLQGETTAFTKEQMQKYGNETMNAKEATEEAEKAHEEYMKELEKTKEKWGEYADKVKEVTDEFGNLDDRTEALGDTLGEMMGTNKFEQNMLDIRNAAADMIEGFKDDDGNISSTMMSLSQMDQIGRDNVEAMEDLADAVGEELMRAFQDSGGSMTEMMKTQSKLRDEFVWTATAAGVPTEKVQELADTIFATPDEIAVAVVLSGQEEAKAKIDALGLAIDDIPPEFKSQYMALIDAGDFVGTWKLGQQIIDNQGAVTANLITEATPIGPVLTDLQREAAKADIPAWLYTKPKSTKPTTEDMQRNTADLSTDVIPKPTSTRSTTSTMQSNTNDLTTDVKPVPTSTFSATNTMQGWTNDITTKVNAQPTSPQSAHDTMQWTLASDPFEVSTNAKQGDVSGAHNSMQWWMGQNPLTVPVNPRIVIDAAWRNTVAGLQKSVTFGYVPGAAPPTASQQPGVSTMSVGAPPPVAAGRYAPQSTPSIINLNISMPLPVGADETRVVAALKRYTNNNGALPLKIAGVHR